jgi:hypothetical protein
MFQRFMAELREGHPKLAVNFLEDMAHGHEVSHFNWERRLSDGQRHNEFRANSVHPGQAFSHCQPAARSTEMLQAWLDEYTPGRLGLSGQSIVECRESGLADYMQMVEAPCGNTLNAALKMHGNPGKLAAELHEVVVEDGPDVPPLAMHGGWDEIYRARNAAGDLSPEDAATWVLRGWSSGVDLNVLSEMGSCHGAWKSMAQNPELIGRTLYRLNASTWNPDMYGEQGPDESMHTDCRFSVADAKARMDWLLGMIKIEPGFTDALFSVFPSPYGNLPVPLAESLQEKDASFNPAADGKIDGILSMNPTLCSWLAAKGYLSPDDLFGLLKRDGIGFPWSGKNPYAALPFPSWSKMQVTRLKDSAAHLEGEFASEYLCAQGAHPSWDVWVAGFTSRPHYSVSDEAHGRITQSLVARGVEPPSGLIGKTLAMVIGYDGNLSSRSTSFQRGEMQPEQGQMLAHWVRSSRLAGLHLTTEDCTQLRGALRGARVNRAQKTIIAELADIPGAEGLDFSKVPELRSINLGRREIEVERKGCLMDMIRNNRKWSDFCSEPQPIGMLGEPGYNFKPELFRQAQANVRLAAEKRWFGSGDALARENAAAGRLATVFEDIAQVDEYVRQRVDGPIEERRDKNPYINAANFDLPLKPGWSGPLWSVAALRHGPIALRLLDKFGSQMPWLPT